ncbi:MAG: RDD family protein [Planctomycetes bacterium]|nr:RDD family protein [Planctomycetota bacterium]
MSKRKHTKRGTDRVSVSDLHAALLQQMELDLEQLIFRHQGRLESLTDSEVTGVRGRERTSGVIGRLPETDRVVSAPDDTAGLTSVDSRRGIGYAQRQCSPSVSIHKEAADVSVGSAYRVRDRRHESRMSNGSEAFHRQADSPPHVGLAMPVETPENVILNYQLAGPAVRGAAYMIDLLIRGAFLYLASLLLGLFAVVSQMMATGFFQIFAFLVQWAYYVVCEGFFNGKTIGKHAMGLRVIQERGYPITFWSASLRNLLRIADGMPYLITGGLGFVFFYGVGFLTMLFSKKLQRLGDIVAGTVVITERHIVLPREPIILERIQPLPREEIGAYVPDARVLSSIEQFLGRRFVLAHERGHLLAGILAGVLAERLHFQGERKLVQQYPMAFLARVYVTFLQRSEEEEEEEFEFRQPRSRRRPDLSLRGRR